MLTTCGDEEPGVRIRTMMALSTGAAMGAGVMYLLDPEHGPLRRRDARRQLAAQARAGAVRSAADARRRAEELATSALVGYQQARAEAGGQRS